MTSSAAVNPLSVSTPSDGGQSTTTTSNSSPNLSSARLSAYSRPARISSIASAPAKSMLDGSSVMPSAVVSRAAFGSTSPSSTSCTEIGSLSGSCPNEKVRQPCGSRSTSSTRRPLSATAAPSEATVVVLATPPFWLAIASTRVSVTSAAPPSSPRGHSAILASSPGSAGSIALQAESVCMGVENHRLVLLRHGETEWSKSDQHTSRTEHELTDTGRDQATAAGRALDELHLDNPVVVTSPRRRAVATAELAGLAVDEKTPLIAEWDYGSYEGLTTAQIRESDPDWLVWTHGCPGCASPCFQPFFKNTL